jgi:hypothetical protein
MNGETVQNNFDLRYQFSGNTRRQLNENKQPNLQDIKDGVEIRVEKNEENAQVS